jgi:hypothetical protein
MQQCTHLAADGLINLSDKFSLLRVGRRNNIGLDGLVNESFQVEKLFGLFGGSFWPFSKQPFNRVRIGLICFRWAALVIGFFGCPLALSAPPENFRPSLSSISTFIRISL